jgi:hypothetical protein
MGEDDRRRKEGLNVEGMDGGGWKKRREIGRDAGI